MWRWLTRDPGQDLKSPAPAYTHISHGAYRYKCEAEIHDDFIDEYEAALEAEAELEAEEEAEDEDDDGDSADDA